MKVCRAYPGCRIASDAPGTYAGYGVKTIPGVSEALEQGRFPEAKEQLTMVAKAINGEATYIQEIVDKFGGSGK